MHPPPVYTDDIHHLSYLLSLSIPEYLGQPRISHSWGAQGSQNTKHFCVIEKFRDVPNHGSTENPGILSMCEISGDIPSILGYLLFHDPGFACLGHHRISWVSGDTSYSWIHEIPWCPRYPTAPAAALAARTKCPLLATLISPLCSSHVTTHMTDLWLMWHTLIHFFPCKNIFAQRKRQKIF